MSQSKLTKQKIALAFTAAVIADAIQFPITAATMTGVLAIPGEGADLMVDSIMTVVTSTLLGFHWILLPSFVFEAIPGFDLFPTWTGCVAYVVWRRKKEQATASVVDVVEVMPPLLPNPKPTKPRAQIKSCSFSDTPRD
jgi:hypothetical protein